MESTYKVIYSGEILEGFNLNEVEAEFAKLFGVPVGKVNNYLKPNKIIKKDLTHARANVYKLKLEKIGLNIILEEEHASFAAMELELEANLQQAQSEREQQDTASVIQPKPLAVETSNPTIEATPATPKSFDINSLSVMGLEDANTNDEQAASSTSNMGNGEFSCPKCGTQQPKSDQCVNFSCGVYFSKFKQAQEQSDQLQETVVDESAEDAEDALTLFEKMKPLIAGFVVSLVGMYVYVRISAELEFFNLWPVVIIGGIVGVTINALNKYQRDLRVAASIVTFVSLIFGTVIGIGMIKDEAVEKMKEGLDMLATMYSGAIFKMNSQLLLKKKK